MLLPHQITSIAFVCPSDLVVGILCFQLLCSHRMICSPKALEEERESKSKAGMVITVRAYQAAETPQSNWMLWEKPTAMEDATDPLSVKGSLAPVSM